MKLFVNVEAPIGQSLVRSNTDLSPISFPELVIGNGREYELYFIDNTGAFVSWSGNAGYVPQIALSECGFPTGGTYKLTFDGYTTGAIAYNASAATVQAALEGLTSIGSGNVLVTGVAGKYFHIEFIGSLAGADQPEITADPDGLTPASNIDPQTLVEGDTGINEEQAIVFGLNPFSFADNWTPVSNGWLGQLSTATFELIQRQAASGTVTCLFQIDVQPPIGLPRTYVKVDASVVCTTINPTAYANASKPLLATQAALAAAILGAGNFTREDLTSSSAGNTNVAIPAGGKHHKATVAVTGVASTRTISVTTTNATVGAVALIAVQPDSTPGKVIEIRNATSGGTLLKSVTTDDTTRTYFFLVEYNGTAWVLLTSDANLLSTIGNLAELTDKPLARANLKSLLGTYDGTQTADFTVADTDDGKFFDIDNVTDTEVTLPSAATVGDGFTLALRKGTNNTNTIVTDDITVTLKAQGDAVILRSNGSSWDVVMHTIGTAIPAPLAPTTGDIIYFNGTDWVVLPIGTSNQVLIVSAGVPAYATRNMVYELAQTGIGSDAAMTNALPANARLTGIIAINETANAITGLEIGTTALDDDVVLATAIGANAMVELPLETTLPFGTTTGTLYLSAAAWNSGTVKLIVLYQIVS